MSLRGSVEREPHLELILIIDVHAAAIDCTCSMQQNTVQPSSHVKGCSDSL